MKRIDFVNELAARLEIKRSDLIEKDVIVHSILQNLTSTIQRNLDKVKNAYIFCTKNCDRVDEIVAGKWESWRARTSSLNLADDNKT